jgi:hypothetical protein
MADSGLDVDQPTVDCWRKASAAITVDFGWSDAKTRDPGNTFRITFRHRNGKETGRIDVDQAKAEQFTSQT